MRARRPRTRCTPSRRTPKSCSTSPRPYVASLTQIGNACGTIGLLHAISNSRAASAVQAGTPLAQLLEAARSAPQEQRPQLLETCDALRDAHAQTAGEGQTAAPEAHAQVDLHFVAFVRGPSGKLIELDGRRRGPIERDVDVPTAADLLTAAAQFVQTYYVCATTDPDASGSRPGAVQSHCPRP